MLNVDTHVLIDALRGEPRPRERRLLAADRWSVAAIVLWELAKTKGAEPEGSAPRAVTMRRRRF